VESVSQEANHSYVTAKENNRRSLAGQRRRMASYGPVILICSVAKKRVTLEEEDERQRAMHSG